MSSLIYRFIDQFDNENYINEEAQRLLDVHIQHLYNASSRKLLNGDVTMEKTVHDQTLIKRDQLQTDAGAKSPQIRGYELD